MVTPQNKQHSAWHLPVHENQAQTRLSIPASGMVKTKHLGLNI